MEIDLDEPKIQDDAAGGRVIGTFGKEPAVAGGFGIEVIGDVAQVRGRDLGDQPPMVFFQDILVLIMV